MGGRRTTVAEWNTELLERFSGRCVLVDARFGEDNTYIPVSCVALHRCPECGGEWRVKPTSIRTGHSKCCRNCSSRMRSERTRPATDTRYREIIERTFNGRSILLRVLDYRRGRVEITCPECGVSWPTRVDQIYSGASTRCKKCGRKAAGVSISKTMTKWTADSFSAWLDNRFQGKSRLLWFVNGGSPALLTCPECGGDWKPTPFSVIKGASTRCKECYWESRKGVPRPPGVVEKMIETKRRTYPEILGISDRLGITLITTEEEFNDGYRSPLDPLRWVCPRCGDVWEATVTSVTFGKSKGCSKCSPVAPVSADEAQRRITERGLRVSLVEETYTKATAAADFICEVCGHKWTAEFAYLQDLKYGCPVCSKKEAASARTYSGAEIQARLESNGRKVSIKVETYTGIESEAVFICHMCGGEFKACVNNVVNSGTGCQTCAYYGFDPRQSAIMYVVRLPLSNRVDGIVIGITNRSLAERYRDESILLTEDSHTFRFESGYDARSAERETKLRLREFCINDASLSPFKHKRGTTGEILVGDIRYLRKVICQIAESHGGVLQ